MSMRARVVAAGGVIRAHWPYLLLGAAVVALYTPVIVGLVDQWYHDDNYSHGFIVPFLSVYLIWQRREVLQAISTQPSWFGLVVVLGTLGLLFLGRLGAELFLTRVALLGTIIGLLLYFAGGKMLRALAFPLAFLLLMVPLPAIIFTQIVFPLQLLASQFATISLEVINVVPILREGNLLVLPNYTIEVVEACSGIRSLMTLLTLALGYGYMVETSVVVRGFLAVAMVPIAVVSNGFRVVGSALVTHYWGPEVAEGFLHSFAGWVIFLVSTLMLLLAHSVVVWVRQWAGRGGTA